MIKHVLSFALILLLLNASMGVFADEQWGLYNTGDGLVGESIQSIQEDAKGYLWFITDYDGASRYDGVRFQNLNVSDGLSSNNVYFTLADKMGNFWFATDRGVSKYDGRDFRNFSKSDGLADDIVRFILEDREGNLWFGTEKGVSKYDGEVFQTFDKASGLADDNINFILEDMEGNIWFGAEKGVSRYDARGFSTANLFERIKVIFQDGNRNLWFGTEKGVYRKPVGSSIIEGPLVEADVLNILEDRSGNLWFGTSRGAIRYETRGTARQHVLTGNSILSMLEDSRGNIWFGTDKGISRYGSNSEDDISLSFVMDILEDSDGNLWFGAKNGVGKYTIQNIQQFTEEDGLAGNSVKAILEDKSGDLWFGTEGRGLSKYDGKAFRNSDVSDGLLDDSILSILQDSKGDLWLGTVSGISRYDGASFTSVMGAEVLMNTAVRAILEDKVTGDLWFANEDGVVRYDGTSFENWAIDNGSETFMDSDRNLWVGSWTDGIYKYDGKSWKHYRVEDGPGSNSTNWILETHDGNIWFGLEGGMTEPGGVCRYDGESFRNFTTDDGLASDQIRDALEDSKGVLWLVTDKGVTRYDSRQESPNFQTITKADGLISSNFSSILLDKGGNLWFGAREGVSKYDGENFQNIPLDLTLGTIHTVFEDSKGVMWFVTTQDGVIKYIPTSLEVRPRIHLTQVEADKIYRNVDTIRVPSTTGRITFEYKGISFKTRPGGMRYTYWLEGYDQTWCPTTNATRVYYEDLRPGHYQFEVRAIDRDLHKSDPPATISIDVFRPLYSAWYFTGAILLGGIGILAVGGYLMVQLNRQRRTAAQLRNRLRMQEEAEWMQMVKMRSLRQLVAGLMHTMNNPIGVIFSSNDVSDRTVGKISSILTQEYPQILSGSKQLAKLLAVLQSASQTTKTASEQMANLVSRLRKFVRLDESGWQTTDINEAIDDTIALMEMECPGRIRITKEYADLPGIFCSPGSLNEAFMGLLRNACEAIDEEGEIKVTTSIYEQYVEIEISDTGRGISSENFDRIFDPGFTTKGMDVGVGLGLSICHKIIVDDHKGRILVSSKLGEGTTFTILLPLS